MLEEGKYYWVRMKSDMHMEVCRYSDRVFYSTRGYDMFASMVFDYIPEPLRVTNSL